MPIGIRCRALRRMQEMQEMSSCSSKEIRGKKIMEYIRYRRGMSDLRHLRHGFGAADDWCAEPRFYRPLTPPPSPTSLYTDPPDHRARRYREVFVYHDRTNSTNFPTVRT